MERHIAIYMRVSSRQQSLRSQRPDLQRWVDAFAQSFPVVWYEDQFSGRSMQRPGWDQLLTKARAGIVKKIVVWRLDRLGRTAKGLTSLLDELPTLGIGLVSLKDGLDLETPAGRLMANVLASVAQYETEIRAERVLAGQRKAREQGKTWGGSQPGRLISLSQEQVDAIIDLHRQDRPKAAIARATGVSRPTVYRVINQHARRCGNTTVQKDDFLF